MKRSLTVILGLCMALDAFAWAVAAQAAEQYPVKPIFSITSAEPGADLDVLSRPLMQKASAVLGKPIIVLNKPGAGGTIGYREIHDAKPDGYAIGPATITIIITRLQGLLPFDYQDYTFLGTFYRMQAIVFGSTRTKRPFKTIPEAISFAKSHPGDVSMASAGIGTAAWVPLMAFVKGTGIDVNIIPQPGGTGMALAQVAGGHMDLTVAFLPSAKPQIDAGNVRFLAVIGDERAPGYENIPTLKDIGYDITWESSGFIVGPPKMPKEVVDKLTKAFEVAANDPEYQKFLTDRFTTPFYIPPDKIIPYLDAKRTVLRDIMGKAGILKDK
jgi:tripartite-type tricarboxylate transporter receptor subunit TctC